MKYLPLLLLALGELTAPVTATNGSCISAPQSACTSLVAICVNKVASGQVASNSFWSAPECFAAATCASPAAIVDAACCAGTCVSLAKMNSLDYNLVYAPMVGSCAFTTGCSVTWTDYVNYFYFTIQTTNTNTWPFSGDDVLFWWSEIATWTAFCSGTLCVNGQIPYLNLNDWLHFSSITLITIPGNPPIRDPPSTVRDSNTDVWDPTADDACPFTDQAFCFEDNSPQQPPDTGQTALAATVQPPLQRKLASFQFTPTDRRLTAESLATAIKYLPPNVPPPVYITNGTQKVPIELNLTGEGPPRRRGYALVERAVTPQAISLEKRPAVRSDVCKGSIDTPSTLPVLTYYCDYLPNICASIRASGFLTSDKVVLTYDPFGSGTRRKSVCTTTQKALFRASSGCDQSQHDPLYWNVSCDEFPFNSVLEGGAANGAIVKGVPTREQEYQGTLQTALSKLLRLENDARSQWSKPGNIKSKFPGMCHKFVLQLVDTVTRSPETEKAVGTLYSGSAFVLNHGAQQTITLMDSRAEVPPAPRATPYDYPSDAAALQPTRSYTPFDCRPCTIGSVNGASAALLDAFNNVTRAAFQLDVAAAATCTKTTPTSTPTPTADGSSHAADAATAVAVAKAAATSVKQSAAINEAVQVAVQAAQAAAAAAAVVAAAAVANNAVSMASSLASSLVAQDVLQSAIASLTDIFGTATIPASVAAVILAVSTVAADASSAITDTWNTKPPATNPVPPDSDPARSPTTNSAGGVNVAPAACFGAGSSGKITINGPFIWEVTGTATETASMVDAGNTAYFAVNLQSTGVVSLDTLCSGIYAWFSNSGPSFQVSCSSDEFGSYWNTVKQQCYSFPLTTDYGIVCANDVGSIYSCLQSNGYQSQITAISFTWSS